MTSKVQLFNQVLLDFGFDRIDDPDSPEREAVILRELYPRARDEVLSLRHWACATRRSDLAVVVEDHPTHEWGFCYQLPVSDKWIEVQAILSRDNQYYEIVGAPWIIEGNRLYTNERRVAIRYTARIEVPEMHHHVVSLLQAKLAMFSAIPLKESVTLAREMQMKFENTLLDAAHFETKVSGSRVGGDRPRSKVAGGTGTKRYHRS